MSPTFALPFLSQNESQHLILYSKNDQMLGNCLDKRYHVGVKLN